MKAANPSARAIQMALEISACLKGRTRPPRLITARSTKSRIRMAALKTIQKISIERLVQAKTKSTTELRPAQGLSPNGRLPEPGAEDGPRLWPVTENTAHDLGVARGG